jgi:mycoredoxin
LNKLGIPFQEINISEDEEAEQFVIYINGGNRSTPTVVLGEGKWKVVLTEPSDEQLEAALVGAGYPLPD